MNEVENEAMSAFLISHELWGIKINNQFIQPVPRLHTVKMFDSRNLLRPLAASPLDMQPNSAAINSVRRHSPAPNL